MSATQIDEGKLEAFMGQAVVDMGAVISAPLFVIGEKLGLYRAMAGAGPLSSEEVAERAGAAERYVREWLRNQAAPARSATSWELSGPAPAMALYSPSFSPIMNSGALATAPMSTTACPMKASSLPSSICVALIVASQLVSRDEVAARSAISRTSDRNAC
jgi:hypothetical protein